MKKSLNLPAAIALGLALVHGPATASDAAMAKLTECMKMGAATPEQAKCLKAVEALRKPPAKAGAMAVAAAPPKLKSATAGSPPTPPKVIEVPAEFKAAAAEVKLNGATTGTKSVSASGGVTAADLKGMDLETAMMAIQAQRASLLEEQLKSQMDAIMKRNEEIAKLNTLVLELNKLRPAGTDPEKFANLGATAVEGKALYARLQTAGVDIPASGPDKVDEAGGSGIYDAKQKTFDQWVAQLKGQIDGINANQQMDMIRMQSLTNKRNEAFELMSNFIKKMADNRSSILGNMR
jgi:hypothetical protein